MEQEPIGGQARLLLNPLYKLDENRRCFSLANLALEPADHTVPTPGECEATYADDAHAGGANGFLRLQAKYCRCEGSACE